MGVRKGSARRFEVPYTFEVQTPHVKWANPLPGGPIRLLAVPSVAEGRTIVEIAQRLSLDLTTVSIDPAWDVNKWTMAFGRDYGARAERGDLKLIYSYLEQELTSDKQFDAILLPIHHGWEQLTPASREALARRVREGCGLILIRPDGGELAPIVPVDLTPENMREEGTRAGGRTDESPWRRVGDHYITRAIPVETFPFGDVQTFMYKAQPGATVLIQTETGHPVAAVRQVGKGRVVAFGYRNRGLSWYMPRDAGARFPDASWEYFYALLSRSIIYAAGREPASAPDFNAASAIWRLRSAMNEVKASGRGRPPEFSKLAPGRYFLEQQTPADFNISVIEIAQPDSIEDLAATPEVIAEGATVEVRFRSTRPARIELVDGFGRVIAQGNGSGTVRLKAGRPLTHSGVVRATCGTVVKQRPVQYAASSREWNDYEVIMPWYGPGSYQPWIPALDEQFRKAGITTLAGPERNFKMMASAHLPGFGIYWYRRDNYVKRKEMYADTKDKQYLRREVSFESPEFEEGLKAQLAKRFRQLAALKPLATYLSDESSVTFYADAFDVDWSPESLAGFRQWLQKEYADLDALNSTWGTSFKNWESVVPMTTEEAQQHGNFAPWADHRAYMEYQFIRAFGKARDLVHEIDPGGRASISGTQVPTPHNGANWYEIDQQIDYLQPYSGGSQDPMHFSFRPGRPMTGFTGYGLVGAEAQYQQWQRLFYGHTGASIFWHYTMLNPDLTLSEQGKALGEAFGRIQSGIGRVFMNSTVREDGVGIHFSMASIRGAWITDGKIARGLANAERTSKNFADLAKRRTAWVKELERQGVQFRFLATPQIESGILDNYRVLILPYSIALSDKEIRAIERFMDRGGIVYGDEQTGRMDERCRWRKEQVWARGRKGFISTGPREVGVQRGYPGDSLVTIRDFGKARLTAVLPKETVRIDAPSGGGVVYDLLRGGLAQASVEASQEKPALFLERPAKIAKISIDRNLNIRLLEEGGAPVDLSVVRVEVSDPTGRPVRHYSSNVTLRDGRATLQIPFAINDAKGAWRVRARDVVSGLTAEVTLKR